MTLLPFCMINWMFGWPKPEGTLDHQALAPMGAAQFAGGLPAVPLPQAAAVAQ